MILIALFLPIFYTMIKIIALFYKYFYSINNNDIVWASLKNKYVLVTSASTEFSQSLCHWLSNKKINLVLIGQNEDKLIDLKSKLIQKVDVYIHPMNISNCSDFSFLDKYDIGLLINCIGDIETVPEYFIDQSIESIIDSQLKAPMCLIKTVMTMMIEKHKGFIINIAFGHCSKPTPHMSLKYAIKSTFKSWSESMYYEMMPYNVNVEYVEIGRMASDGNSIFPNIEKVSKDVVDTLGSSYFTVPSFIHLIFFIFRQILPRSVIGRLRNNLNQEMKKIHLSQNQ